MSAIEIYCDVLKQVPVVKVNNHLIYWLNQRMKEHILQDIFQKLSGSADVLQLIEQVITGYFGIKTFRKQSRKRDVVFPRQLAMYFSKSFTHYSYNEIGKYYDRHHVTAMHSYKTICDLLEIKDKQVIKAVEDITILLQNSVVPYNDNK